jgi:nucleoside-diphosphate-sugar epimerase
MSKIIVVAGANGNLGSKIIDALILQGATVRALVRKNITDSKIELLKQKPIEITYFKSYKDAQVKNACKGATCIISALSGLQEVIIDAQKELLQTAINAGVPRFIPSDFCSDYINLVYGYNRNLDFRKEFHTYINTQAIKTTSIFNGAFMELITGDMPFIMFTKNKILHWGDASILMDFTHTDNVAAYTAATALDDTAPRYLKIAGERISAKGTAMLMTNLTDKPFKLFRPGGIKFFNFIIKMTRFFSPAKKELYPAWQGMQYMRDMMEGKINAEQLDNNRYTISWIDLKHYLQSKNKV